MKKNTMQRGGIRFAGITGALLLIVAMFGFGQGQGATGTGSEAPDHSDSDSDSEMIATDGGEIVTETVAYHRADGEQIQGYLAMPQEATQDSDDAMASLPAIILIHEWWGLNNDIRAKARQFAQAGYVALAVDLYNGEATDRPARATTLAQGVQQDMPGAFANLNAAVDYIQSLESVDGSRIASVGWCFGGGWSYQMALNNLGVQASIIYYGRFNPRDDLEKMRATILGHFAEDDVSIRVSTVREFEARLDTLNGAHEIYIYPNSQHGFANPENTRVYNRESAERAWDRTLTFLSRIL